MTKVGHFVSSHGIVAIALIMCFLGIFMSWSYKRNGKTNGASHLSEMAGQTIQFVKSNFLSILNAWLD